MQAMVSLAEVWYLVVIPILGLGSTWLARVSEGSAREQWWQTLFFAFLGLVAGATLVAMQIGPAAGIASGATLAMMALGATCDFSRR
ncbi:MAG TPA: hypothetical protein VHZ24_04540 [Pirellulales bacterium]|jgi:hypothetical protein|nr:hypothetical protein [Pirellulales bacterium]